MCTLSWRHSSSHTLILFNRDESIKRGPEGPLEERHLSSTKIACPTDSNAGGTWIGVNEYGCALALLNHYPDEVTSTSPARSRGQLVLELLDISKPMDLAERVKNIDLDLYAPFRLIALNRNIAQQVVWNRKKLSLNTPLPPLGSSSLDDNRIPQARAERFKVLPATDEAQMEFHRSHLPEKGAWSTCMHRPDARTCSFTRILLKEDTAQIKHISKSPCEAQEGDGKILTLTLQHNRA